MLVELSIKDQTKRLLPTSIKISSKECTARPTNGHGDSYANVETVTSMTNCDKTKLGL